jgi:hypothetical protein
MGRRLSGRGSRMTVGSAVVAGALVLCSSPAPAFAYGHGYEVSRTRTVSGPSPFAAGCPGALQDAGRVPGAELEPSATTNPANPGNIVATWQQDPNPGGRTDLIGWSRDGGRSWQRSAIPGLTRCTGGTADAASDPWLSAGVDGTVYFLGMTLDLSGSLEDPPSTLVASHSRDGGRTWSRPSTVSPVELGNETDAITASPTRAGHAYAAWANWNHSYTPPMTNTLRFSRTTDRGVTWSPAVVVDRPDPVSLDLSPRVVVLPDGSLVMAFARVDITTGIGSLHATRSLDEGRTWLPPVQIGSQQTQKFFDPETGDELPQPGFISAAVGPDGTVYLGFEQDSSTTAGSIVVARSRDGGRTWISVPVGGISAFAFHPALAVDMAGVVGLTWYDLRNDRPGDATLTADAWFAASTDRGTSWRQTHLAGPLDLRSAPFRANGHQLGEYQGLAALHGSRGFAAIFTVPAPLARNGPTDIRFTRITPA